VSPLRAEDGELEQFRELLTHKLGLRFDDEKDEVLRGLLHERMRALRERSFGGYRQRLEGGDTQGAQELRALAERLTVGETYFFRHVAQLNAFAEVALPERLAIRGPAGLRVLSAGCATGEEPFSLAILLRQRLGESTPRGAILGADLNPAFLEHARAGRYSSWALRETPEQLRETWFHKEDRGTWLLDARVRELVTFEEHNLHDAHASLWAPERFDVIFCRNVTIYFSAPARRALIQRFARALAPGGFLFLGHTETLRGVSEDFHLRHSQEAFYYQLRTTEELLRHPQTTLQWPQSIGHASERIARLEHEKGVPSAPVRAAPAPSPGRKDATASERPPLRALMELFREERYAEVLESLPKAEADPDALLLRAAALTSQGHLAEAEQVAQRLLEQDEFNAGAHYITALCRDDAGEADAAEEHDRIAIYLDGTFAMPHLHLGLMLRREGRVHHARRELEEALVLLAREDPVRVLLFGGGFGREAIMQICRAELRAAGGEP
jgi:chemotaxis protein methyltransferase CheR